MSYAVSILAWTCTKGTTRGLQAVATPVCTTTLVAMRGMLCSTACVACWDVLIAALQNVVCNICCGLASADAVLQQRPCVAAEPWRAEQERVKAIWKKS